MEGNDGKDPMKENADCEQLFYKINAIEQELKEIRLVLEEKTNSIIRFIAERRYTEFQIKEQFTGGQQTENQKDMLLGWLNKLEKEIQALRERTQRTF